MCCRQNVQYCALWIDGSDSKFSLVKAHPCIIKVLALWTAAIFPSLSMCTCVNSPLMDESKWLIFLHQRAGWEFHEFQFSGALPVSWSSSWQQLVVSGGRSPHTPGSSSQHHCGCSGMLACCIGSTWVVPRWASLPLPTRCRRVLPVQYSFKFHWRSVTVLCWSA